MATAYNIFLLSSGVNGRLDPVQSNLLSLSFNDSGSLTLGVNNNLSGCTSSILGGYSNIICNSPGSFPVGVSSSDLKNNTIIGGSSNCIDRSSDSVIGGGKINCVKGWFIGDTASIRFGRTNVIGGGVSNYILGDTSLIAGGYNNCIVSGYINGIHGGCNNKIATSNCSNIFGGVNNIVCSSASTILVGDSNCIKTGSNDSLILGGGGNCIRENSSSSTILVGSYNSVSGSYLSTIVNGASACIKKSDYSSILHGSNSTIEQSEWSTILSSYNSCIKNAGFSTIANGYNNIISGSFYQSPGNIGVEAIYASTILNGENNSIYGTNSSILAGSNSKICSGHIGATIIADSQVRNHNSSGPHTLTLDFASGIYVSGGLYLNGRQLLVSAAGNVFSPTVTAG
jgi:hypothetical protein